MNWYCRQCFVYLPMEKPIGHNYFITETGDVISRKPGRKEKLLKAHKCTKGYLQISIWKDGKGTSTCIHRLVAINFLPPAPIGFEQVNHKDGNKLNNHVDNLEWVSNRENGSHKFIGKGLTSKYTNISWETFTGKWKASITFKGKIHNLGRYKTEEQALEVLNKFKVENNIVNRYSEKAKQEAEEMSETIIETYEREKV